MRFEFLRVENYKGLRDIEAPLSTFVCVVGENNAGKSSLLQALMLFLRGDKLAPAQVYYDSQKPVVITVRVVDIGNEDLALIAEEHRTRIKNIIIDGAVTFVRRYDTTGGNSLRYIAQVPKDARFSASRIDALVKGKKASSTLAAAVINAFPELAGKVDASTGTGAIRELIATAAEAVPASERTAEETDLPSGIDNSIKPMLPEVVYIPAVKDLADDMKTKDASSFGRLLGMLLEVIAPELEKAQEAFAYLRKALNVVEDEHGNATDERLEAVRMIETTVERLLCEHFPNTKLSLHVPPPELKTVLTSATITVDDGTKGDVATKGDGLKRALVFSILRAFAELRRDPAFAGAGAKQGRLLLLFEEPELFLHPTAQRVLFEALRTIAGLHHVVVSTHSPLFLGAQETGTFIKMRKHDAQPPAAPKPYGHALPVDLSDVSLRDRWRLVCFELNNMAFFARRVVLVEGISDFLVLPHLARTLDPGWLGERTGVHCCQVGGKGNFKAHREFFNKFEVPVVIVGDLDCLLDGFDHLGLSDECAGLRFALLQQVDRAINARGATMPAPASLTREATKPQTVQLWQELRRAVASLASGTGTAEDVVAAGDALFAVERNLQRRNVLADQSDAGVLLSKRALLARMREEGVFVLERGAIEQYYPSSVTGRDKPSKALALCDQVTTAADVRALSDPLPTNLDAAGRTELEVIIAGLFGSPGMVATMSVPVQSRDGVKLDRSA